MNIFDIVLIGILALSVFFAVRSIRKKKARGEGCCGCCTNCRNGCK